MDNKSAYDSNIYDAHIVNVLPYYNEYSNQIIDMVQTMCPEKPKWLDTGCGTGTLATKALEVLHDVEFTLSDPSNDMLNLAKKKLGNAEVRYVNLSSDELDYDNEFDVVTAVQCHHYYDAEGREKAVRNCYRALNESGLFITFENIRMATDSSDEIMMKRWIRFLKEHGNSPQDVQMQIDRRGVETHPITVEEHIELLKKCGFRSVNVLWASYLQAGFWAIK